MRKASIN